MSPPPSARTLGRRNQDADDFLSLSLCETKRNASGKPAEAVGFLRGNFSPTTEEKTLADLPVTRGKVPKNLNGVFLRNGPNPFYQPLGKYHWFDGDGMVHGVRLKNGKAFYANRWIETSRLKQERAYGRPVFMKIGELTGKSGLLTLISQKLKARLGILDLSKGSGQANTNLTFHANKVLALHEMDLPYVIKVLCSGAIETIRRASIGPPASQKPPEARTKNPKAERRTDPPATANYPPPLRKIEEFTAHPKVDQETGEMHFFGYNLYSAPHLTYGVLDAEGNLVKSIPIDLPNGPAMMHDMALTKRYAIFLYMPLFFRPKEMVVSGFPFIFDPEMPSKFALLPRDAADASEIVWFNLPAGMIFHVANAWDEEGKDGPKVHLYACSTSDYTLNELVSSNSTKGIHWSREDVSVTPKNNTPYCLTRKAEQNSADMGRFIPGAHGGMGMSTRGDATVDFAAIPRRQLHAMGDPAISLRAASSKSRDILNMSGEETKSEEDRDTFALFHFTFDPATGLATQRRIVDPKQEDCDAYLLEFPIINPRYAMRPNRYVYMATFCDGMKANGFVKCDLTKDEGGGWATMVVGKVEYGKQRFGGECVFVPPPGEEGGEEGEGEEDEGWLITLVYDARVRKSFLLVYDAGTMEVVAEIDLKTRVPFGFHGLFLGEDDLQKQMRGSTTSGGENKGGGDVEMGKV